MSTYRLSELRRLISLLIKESSEEQLLQAFQAGTTGLHDHIEDWVRRFLGLAEKGYVESDDPAVQSLLDHITREVEDDDQLQAELGTAWDVVAKNILVGLIAALAFNTEYPHMFEVRHLRNQGTRILSQINFPKDWVFVVTHTFKQLSKTERDALIEDVVVSFANTVRPDLDYAIASVPQPLIQLRLRLGRLMFEDLLEHCEQGGTITSWAGSYTKKKQIRDFKHVSQHIEVPSDTTLYTELENFIEKIRFNIKKYLTADWAIGNAKNYPELLFILTVDDDRHMLTDEDRKHISGAYVKARHQKLNQMSTANDGVYHRLQAIQDDLVNSLRLRVMPSDDFILDVTSTTGTPVAKQLLQYVH